MHQPIPPEAAEQLAQGRKIAAIKTVREKLGLGLKQAKDLVEAYERGHPVAESVQASSQQEQVEMPGAAIKALRKGRMVDAVKHVRKRSTLGLKDAKDRVDRYLESNPKLNDDYQAAVSEGRHQLVGKLVTLLVIVGAIVYAYRYFFLE
ncbi:MAG: hypothetical protein DHS20C11_05570 [Lysobacteraceae bacterium]|nr:MAG: hypothetical protein DHS20C11_05570 [Xanthomonadaceae bacterium]